MKVGFDQIGVPAPLFYRRMVNALIIIVVPATATMITQFPDDWLEPTSKMALGIAINYLVALLKAFEYVLGSDTAQTNK